MDSNPFFIIGTERSGTNLLRLILNVHSDICIPHPPHIFKFFFPLLPLYGDLQKDKNFQKLVNDVCRMVELHPYPWEIKPDRKKILKEVPERTLIAVFFNIYNQYLEYSEKKRWACKSTFMIHHVDEILRFCPEAQFVFLVRDGRDVAVSAKKSIFNHFNVFYSAHLWKKEQEIGIDLLCKLKPEQIMLLYYEDLIANAEVKTKELCDFLGISFQENMLAFHKSKEAEKSARLSKSWENTSKPIQHNNSRNFKTKLSHSEIILFESIAFKELNALQYELSEPLETLIKAAEYRSRKKMKYFFNEKFLHLNVQWQHFLSDKNNKLRFRKSFFLNRIKIIRKYF